MADDEAELSKPTAEPGFPPGLPHQTAVSGTENQAHGEPQPVEEETLGSLSHDIHTGGKEPDPADAPDPAGCGKQIGSHTAGARWHP